MNVRRPLLACVLAGFSLTLLPAPSRADPAPAAPTADTPAVAAVRHFLEARAAGRYDEAYALLRFNPQPPLSAIPKEDFEKGSSLSPDAERLLPAQVAALLVLFGDTHNTRKYTFTLLGPDPADPASVLVRAEPPASATPPAVAVRLLTKRAAGGALLVDASGSVTRAMPPKTPRERSQDNLQRLALAITMYEQDHDELMPDADKWVDEVMPYVKAKAPFGDPFAPAGQVYGFAFNRALSHKSIADVEAPAATVLLFESTKGVKNASDTGQSVPHPGRDGGGTDYAFVDGHVKWLTDGAKLSFKLSGK